jgi:hypothetical protein
MLIFGWEENQTENKGEKQQTNSIERMSITGIPARHPYFPSFC